MKTFLLPDLGEGLHEAEIVEWHVKAGDTVKADAPIVSVETDKAVVEVPAPWSGRIARLCAAVGERVAVGVAVIEYEGEAEKTHVAAHSVPAPVVRTVIAATPSSRARAMPAVRILAEELGLDIGAVTATGPGGAVTARDVARAFKTVTGIGPAATSAIAPAAGWEPLRGPRRSMADAMERSRDEVMPATVHDDCDIGAWNDSAGILPRLVRAICAGIATEPALNGWFDSARGRKLATSVDLGLAVDTPAGLLVPVLRGVQRLELDELATEIARIVAAAHARTLPPEALKGATFTLSNYGSIAGRHATPVVVPPQVAILGAGRVYRVLRLEAGHPVERPLLPLSLTIDHRAVTGGESARFLAAAMADLALAR